MYPPDCYFFKGRNDHIACQDYALFHEGPDFSIGILTDGCSSSPDTDVGARLLALTARSVLKRTLPSFEVYHNMVIAESRMVMTLLDVPSAALDATLLTAIVGKLPGTVESWIKASMYGDGFLAIRYADGWVRGVQCIYPGGYPKYLSYQLDAERAARRDKVGGSGFTEPFTISPAGELVLGERSLMTGNSYEFACPIPEKAESFFMTSDGILQFAEDASTNGVVTRVGVPFTGPLQGLTGIKGYAGQFVQRRANKFLNKECPGKKWTPLDDVSVLGFNLAGVE